MQFLRRRVGKRKIARSLFCLENGEGVFISFRVCLLGCVFGRSWQCALFLFSLGRVINYYMKGARMCGLLAVILYILIRPGKWRRRVNWYRPIWKRRIEIFEKVKKKKKTFKHPNRVFFHLCNYLPEAASSLGSAKPKMNIPLLTRPRLFQLLPRLIPPCF